MLLVLLSWLEAAGAQRGLTWGYKTSAFRADEISVVIVLARYFHIRSFQEIGSCICDPCIFNFSASCISH